MGFDAKGLALGNAIGANAENNITTYYNPALCAFQERTTFNATYSFLNLDRSLNSFSFIKQIEIKQEDPNKKVTAGIAGGLINAGVSNIEARDYDGFVYDNLSTFENQFFFSVAARFVPNFAVGATFKFYYSKLYDKVTSSGFGVDIGALYKATDKLAVAIILKEINTQYQWDTGQIYGQNGNVTKDKFPLLKQLAVSYKVNDDLTVFSEFENSNQGTNIFRFGCQYTIFDILEIRAGVDRFDLSNTDNGIKPGFGFGLTKEFDIFTPTLNYAFVLEPFTHSPMQMLTLTIQI
jgi:hypothetical protein